MSDYDDYYEEYERPLDPIETKAEGVLYDFFEKNQESVFFSRQVEVRHEHIFFHWVTNRAVRSLIEEGVILSEKRELAKHFWSC